MLEVGTASGCAANDVLSATHRDKMDKRMGWNLDSTKHATFNWNRPIPAYAKAALPLNPGCTRFLDESRIITGPTLFMRACKRGFVFAAGVVLLRLFWALAVGPERPARISTSPGGPVRAVTILGC